MLESRWFPEGKRTQIRKDIHALTLALGYRVYPNPADLIVFSAYLEHYQVLRRSKTFSSLMLEFFPEVPCLAPKLLSHCEVLHDFCEYHPKSKNPERIDPHLVASVLVPTVRLLDVSANQVMAVRELMALPDVPDTDRKFKKKLDEKKALAFFKVGIRPSEVRASIETLALSIIESSQKEPRFGLPKADPPWTPEPSGSGYVHTLPGSYGSKQ